MVRDLSQCPRKNARLQKIDTIIYYEKNNPKHHTVVPVLICCTVNFRSSFLPQNATFFIFNRYI